MSWIRRILGGQPEASAVPGQEPRERPVLSPDDPRIGAGRVALDRFWQGIGTAAPELLEPDHDPELTGPLSWPGRRETYRAVSRDGGLILATDGLSDPFIGKSVAEESGFGVELFLDLPGAGDLSLADLRHHWAFELLTLVARNVAGFGGITDRLDRQGTVLMAMPLERDPGSAWRDSGGYATVLIGLPARGLGLTLSLPFGPVRIVPVTLLRPEEATVALRGDEQRRDLAARLLASGNGHRTDLARPALI
ncbi:MAG: suppressor of fused domain protein [Rhodobacteraceae bacterium]|nr:suppressor of fused domain protein [Paracoccaceae bacterium]